MLNIKNLFETSSEALTFEQQKPYLIRLLQISKNPNINVLKSVIETFITIMLSSEKKFEHLIMNYLYDEINNKNQRLLITAYELIRKKLGYDKKIVTNKLFSLSK